MKRNLFTLLLLCVFAGSYAQSLTFEDLLNLTSMNNTQAHDFLMASKGFKSAGFQMVNGENMEQYKSSGRTPDKTETILLGVNTKGFGGNMHRAVTYLTLLEQDISSFIAEAKRSTLTLIFKGSDLNKNFYRFDNSLFRANISLSFDKKSGTVEVQQKEYVGN
jgi:hypothetical protein